MRILVVSMDRGIRPGGTKGAAIHLSSQCAAWARAGHEVVLVSGARSESAIADGVDVISAVGADPIQLIRDLGDFDLVHERYSLGSVSGITAARELGVPFTLEVNAPLVDEATRYRPETVSPTHRSVEERLFREADTIVAVSNPLARIIAGVGRREDVVVVPNGCDAELFDRWVPHRDRSRTIAFLGHPKPWHGADRIPVIIRELEQRGIDTSLEIIGGGAGADAVTESARRQGVESRVTATGPLEHPDACRRLATHAIAIAPYPPSDSFYFCPIKVIESMAAGCAVVASAVGDMATLTSTAALLVPANDDGAFVDTVAEIMQDERRREELGLAARERALGGLTWNHAAEAVLAASAGHRRRGVV